MRDSLLSGCLMAGVLLDVGRNFLTQSTGGRQDRGRDTEVSGLPIVALVFVWRLWLSALGFFFAMAFPSGDVDAAIGVSSGSPVSDTQRQLFALVSLGACFAGPPCSSSTGLDSS